MARAGRVQHWKHGWIPISPQAKAYVAAREAGKRPLAPPKANLPGPVRTLASLSPKLRGKIIEKLTTAAGMSEAELIARVDANLTDLYKQGVKSDLDWYKNEGSRLRAVTGRINNDFDIDLTPEQFVGMVAVTSAQKRWKENVNFAEAIARKLAADEPFPVTQADIDDYNAWASKRRGPVAKTHTDLAPGTYRPSELPADFVASKTPGMPRTINADAVIHATRIFRNEASLDEVIGGPKQRSFVNNLMNPDDDRFVTVDTWHYRGMMRGIPLTREVGPKGKRRTFSYTLEQWNDMDLAVADGRAEDYGYDPTKDRHDPANIKAAMLAQVPPQDFFQSGPASKADGWDTKFGTYPWFVEQTQATAARLGVSPAGLQAVVWYATGGGA